MKKLVLIFASLLFLFSIPMQGQDGDAKGKSDAAPKDVRLTIIVTGGPDNKPVENASIYVKYVEERKLGKNKKIEMNLKSNIVRRVPRSGYPAWKISGSGDRGRVENVRRIFRHPSE